MLLYVHYVGTTNEKDLLVPYESIIAPKKALYTGLKWMGRR